MIKDICLSLLIAAVLFGVLALLDTWRRYRSLDPVWLWKAVFGARGRTAVILELLILLASLIVFIIANLLT